MSEGGRENDADLPEELLALLDERIARVLAGEAGPSEDWRVVLDRIRRRGPSPPQAEPEVR